MFSRIVVGVDGTSRGRDALALASVLAQADAEVILAHVYAPDAIQLPIGGETTRALRETAQRLLDRVARAAPPGADTAPVPGERPVEDLCAFADRCRADLLVVGSSRHGNVGRVLLGGAARRVVHEASCALAVAPRDYALAPYHAMRFIGVGLNGTPGSHDALTAARALAARLGAELRIVVAIGSALPPPATFPIYGSAWARYRTHTVRAGHELLEDAIAGTRGHASGKLCEQSALTALPALTRECDLVVIGAPHRCRLDRALAGSPADTLLAHASAPVLVMAAAAVDASPAPTSRPVAS